MSSPQAHEACAFIVSLLAKEETGTEKDVNSFEALKQVGDRSECKLRHSAVKHADPETTQAWCP